MCKILDRWTTLLTKPLKSSVKQVIKTASQVIDGKLYTVSTRQLINTITRYSTDTHSLILDFTNTVVELTGLNSDAKTMMSNKISDFLEVYHYLEASK